MRDPSLAVFVLISGQRKANSDYAQEGQDSMRNSR